MRFADLASAREERATAAEMRRLARAYADAAELDGWDGEWYRRAYFDDGTPLGRRLTPNARLIRLRRAGLFFRVRAILSVRAGPWKRWISASFAANMD